MKHSWCVLVRTLVVLGLLALCAVSCQAYTLEENDIEPNGDIMMEPSKSAYPIHARKPSIYNLFSAYMKSRESEKERSKRKPMSIAGIDNIHFLMSSPNAQRGGGGGGGGSRSRPKSDARKVSADALRQLFLAGR